MTDRIAESGAIKYAAENTGTATTSPNRLAASGYLHAAYSEFMTWTTANPGVNPSRLSAKGRLFGYFYDNATPLNLFATGAQGAWYDPSDYTTLFEDSAGTIPITSPLEKPVGLMLDKSKGLVLGPELVTNGDFSGASLAGFTPRGGTSVLTITNGQLVCTSANAGAIAVIPTVVGKMYQIVSSITAASATVYIDKSDNSSVFTNRVGIVAAATAPQLAKTGVFTATATTSYIWFWVNDGTAGSSITIDNISVRELPGNHCYQSTTTSRPTLSARYNLLTKTEQFDDAAWVVSNVTKSGTNEAVLTGSAGTVRKTFTQSTALAVSGSVKVSFRLRNISHQYVQLYFAGSNTTQYANFDLSDYGALGTQSNSTATITKVSTGVFDCSVTATLSADAAFGISFCFIDAANFTRAASSSSTGQIAVSVPDLRFSNDGVNLPSYQRVDTATSYDYAGFPAYVRFDGIDDSLATGTVTPGTDKAQVFAGVRKLTDTQQYITTAGNSGAGYLLLQNYTDGKFYYGSGGSSFVQIDSGAMPSPVTKVITGISSISDPVITLRVNAAQVSTSTSSQGTGNYGANAISVSTTGKPFNGRIYSLIVRFGPTLSASEITSTENWVNSRTKAY